MNVWVHPLFWSLTNPTLIVGFVLILSRIGGLFVTAPLFKMHNIPNPVKIWFSVILGLFVVCSCFGWPPQLSNLERAHVESLPALVFWMAWEFILGWLLGTVAQWLFDAVKITGELISTQMGLSTAAALDPISGTMNPVLAESFSLFATLLFLSLNLHHWLIGAVVSSFKLVPLATMPSNSMWVGDAVLQAITWLAEAFQLGLMLAAPTIALLLLAEIALGFVAKLMPQLNVFIVGIPLKIVLGLFSMGLSMAALTDDLSRHWNTSFKELLLLFKGMGG
jgi:flagellar biosynthesis protein FliR